MCGSETSLLSKSPGPRLRLPLSNPYSTPKSSQGSWPRLSQSGTPDPCSWLSSPQENGVLWLTSALSTTSPLVTCTRCPTIQDNLDRVGKAKWFTAIYLLAGFHQIEMDETAYKTAFQTPFGQYMYIRMPMGLKSAPSTFCRIVGAMLQGAVADTGAMTLAPESG